MEIDKHFKRLGIKKDASAKDIRRAYRQKAKKVHPDTSSNNGEIAEEEFKKLNEAYIEALKHEKTSKSPQIHTRKWRSSSPRTSFRTNPRSTFGNFSQLFDELISSIFNVKPRSKFERKSKFHNNSRFDRSGFRHSHRTLNKCGKPHPPHLVCLICEN